MLWFDEIPDYFVQMFMAVGGIIFCKRQQLLLEFEDSNKKSPFGSDFTDTFLERILKLFDKILVGWRVDFSLP